MQQIIQGCIQGDRHSQNLLYNQFAPKMFVVCLRYARDRHEAEETLQEGFLQVFKSLHTFRNTGSFEGWVRKIMLNCSLQVYRSRPRMHAIIQAESDMIDEPFIEDVFSRLSTKEIVQLVQQLSPAYRMVFNLYVFEGMKHREIAELLGISEGTSKSNLSDARQILQKAIERTAAIQNVHCL